MFAIAACASLACRHDATPAGLVATSGERPTPPEGPAPDGTPVGCTHDCGAIDHVLAAGQSLALGSAGAPVLSTSQPFANVMLDTGLTSDGTDAKTFVPLREIALETMSTSFASLVTEGIRAPATARHDLLVTVHAVPGQPYVELKKGRPAYTNALRQVEAGSRIAKAFGKAYDVRAVTVVHGESDHVENNASYAANLIEWQLDYEADVRARTGRDALLPMFHTQMSSWTMQNSTTSTIPIQQLRAHVEAPGRVILVGPKYHLPYADGIHLTNDGYRHMGEDYAKAYRRVVVEGKTWEPVRPKAVARTDRVITVAFMVMSPPLVLDTTLVSDPGNYGFEYADDVGSASIERVDVVAPDTVNVTLTAIPTGASKRLRYAFTGVRGALAGPTTGPRGNLRDSDSTKSRSGYPLYDWCVHFDEPVP